jgi:hypothetical protein
MDDGCHALVDEAASGVGVILERRPLPPTPGGAAVAVGAPRGPAQGSSIRSDDEPSVG